MLTAKNQRNSRHLLHALCVQYWRKTIQPAYADPDRDGSIGRAGFHHRRRRFGMVTFASPRPSSLPDLNGIQHRNTCNGNLTDDEGCRAQSELQNLETRRGG
ncbi:uncharacterized protein LOC127088331 [Lathyrus oleraceus]|uniref:uncharacterized protein LOC127088331 n=1 Tax=Pisum sativum TaxID=3888 RepID=UPI0021D11FA4|nr:uncharacterized protein LOC127088331 [Pisum sativum]